jgi:hypothetical protein
LITLTFLKERVSSWTDNLFQSQGGNPNKLFGTRTGKSNPDLYVVYIQDVR